ncbi:hypothetical protein AgCh_009708 [Apium graveolens]
MLPSQVLDESVVIVAKSSTTLTSSGLINLDASENRGSDIGSTRLRVFPNNFKFNKHILLAYGNSWRNHSLTQKRLNDRMIRHLEKNMRNLNKAYHEMVFVNGVAEIDLLKDSEPIISEDDEDPKKKATKRKSVQTESTQEGKSSQAPLEKTLRHGTISLVGATEENYKAWDSLHSLAQVKCDSKVGTHPHFAQVVERSPLAKKGEATTVVMAVVLTKEEEYDDDN